MSSNADTKPTLETVLERIDAVRTNLGGLREEMNRRFDEHDKRFAEQKKILSDFDVRIDRIEGVAGMTRSDVVNLRADFREFRQKVEEVVKSVA
jgi:cupin superfamily acireductone dioxygenase involved in methionine salvage